MNKKKLIVSLIISITILITGLGYFVLANKELDYKKEYTQEEWDKFSKAQQKEMREKRLCDPDSFLRSTGVDCSKYKL